MVTRLPQVARNLLVDGQCSQRKSVLKSALGHVLVLVLFWNALVDPNVPRAARATLSTGNVVYSTSVPTTMSSSKGNPRNRSKR
jgi:hypothetical protein